VDVRIVGSNLPGRDWGDPRPGGRRYENVHVGIQRRAEVVEAVPADAAAATWDITVDVVDTDGAVDFRGPYVQGRRGDRFLYLSWGTVAGDRRFEMFRRAKLMLDVLDDETVRAASRTGSRLEARLGLTGGDGGPRCAAVRPPGVDWAVASG
jgi:hypothetical protein